MIGLLYIITFISSGISIFVLFKYFTNADNRWNYLYSTFHNKVTFFKIITDVLSFFTYIGLLILGYLQTSLIILGVLIIITIFICYFNNFLVYVLRLLLAYSSKLFSALHKLRNITTLEEYFLNAQPKLNLILFLLTSLLWGVHLLQLNK